MKYQLTNTNNMNVFTPDLWTNWVIQFELFYVSTGTNPEASALRGTVNNLGYIIRIMEVNDIYRGSS